MRQVHISSIRIKPTILLGDGSTAQYQLGERTKRVPEFCNHHQAREGNCKADSTHQPRPPVPTFQRDLGV